MEIKIINEGINKNGQKYLVKAVWGTEGFLYTRTYILDAEGFVEKSITVFADGTISEQ